MLRLIRLCAGFVACALIAGVATESVAQQRPFVRFTLEPKNDQLDPMNLVVYYKGERKEIAVSPPPEGAGIGNVQFHEPEEGVSRKVEVNLDTVGGTEANKFTLTVTFQPRQGRAIELFKLHDSGAHWEGDFYVVIVP